MGSVKELASKIRSLGGVLIVLGIVGIVSAVVIISTWSNNMTVRPQWSGNGDTRYGDVSLYWSEE